MPLGPEFGHRPVEPRGAATVRVIGGKFRGRKLNVAADPRLRPMKDRTREAIFNLLGERVKGTRVFDLFAGTGVVGIEALSRGAAHATFVEQHFPTADALRLNLRLLDLESQAEVVPADALRWHRRLIELNEAHRGAPWTVFVCPPYSLFDERRDDLLELIRAFVQDAAPAGSIVVECDARFDTGLLPESARWIERSYPPARILVHRLGSKESDAGAPPTASPGDQDPHS